MANGSAAVAGKVVIAILAVAALLCSPAAAELPRLEHGPKNDDGSLSILVVGDWGRKGTYNQSRVAEQMGRIGEELDIDFVVSTGDNFYETGLTGVHDPAFEESFTNIYTAKSLQTPWYLVLGNHDYKGDVLAQLSPALRKIDSRFICMRSFIVDAEIVDFFFVDTTPFQLKYWTHPKGDHYDWRQVAPRGKYIANLLKDLDVAVKKSTAKWKIAVGHHTMRSVSDHGDTTELLQMLLPVLKSNGIDFYINGHDHCLEHISSRDRWGDSGTSSTSTSSYPLGDNFYNDGLTSVDDPAFEQSFTDIYTAKSLQKPWYLVLGNHDYRGDALAQLSPVLQKIDSRFICMKSFIVSAEIVDFFFIDTTPFQLKYWTHPKDHVYDWRGVAPQEKYINRLLKDLDTAMKKSTAEWKIVVGHHTMRTVSNHGDTVELLQLLLPILKVNGIDFYINGHDHCLEHISSIDSTSQVEVVRKHGEDSSSQMKIS